MLQLLQGKKVNRILSLENEQGIKVTNNADMCAVAKDYFVNLFQQK